MRNKKERGTPFSFSCRTFDEIPTKVSRRTPAENDCLHPPSHTHRHYTTVVYFLIHSHGSSPAASSCISRPNKPGRWESRRRWRARNDQKRVYPSLNFTRMAHGLLQMISLLSDPIPLFILPPPFQFLYFDVVHWQQTTVRR